MPVALTSHADRQKYFEVRSAVEAGRLTVVDGGDKIAMTAFCDSATVHEAFPRDTVLPSGEVKRHWHCVYPNASQHQKV